MVPTSDADTGQNLVTLLAALSETWTDDHMIKLPLDCIPRIPTLHVSIGTIAHHMFGAHVVDAVLPMVAVYRTGTRIAKSRKDGVYAIDCVNEKDKSSLAETVRLRRAVQLLRVYSGARHGGHVADATIAHNYHHTNI
jgi:hypothetical protein